MAGFDVYKPLGVIGAFLAVSVPFVVQPFIAAIHPLALLVGGFALIFATCLFIIMLALDTVPTDLRLIAAAAGIVGYVVLSCGLIFAYPTVAGADETCRSLQRHMLLKTPTWAGRSEYIAAFKALGCKQQF